MKRTIFYGAIASWMGAVVVNIVCMEGYKFSNPLVLAGVGFPIAGIIWFAAIITLLTNQSYYEYYERAPPFQRSSANLLNTMLDGKPTWLAVLVFFAFFYALINYSVTDPPYSIDNVVRTVSGYFIAVFAYSTLLLYPVDQQNA